MKVKHYYKCESCSSRFHLAEQEPGKDPYPRDEDMPKQENLLLCFVCRRDIDKNFADVVDSYEQES